MMKKLTGLHVNNLTIDNLYGLIKTTVEISLPHQDNIGPLPKAALARLKTIHDAFEQRMKKTFASALTPELNGMNVERNTRYREIKRFVKTASKSSSQTLQKSGNKLLIFLTPYWGTEEEPLNTITSIYEEILSRYHADEQIQAAANVLGITPLITELESINVHYDTIYKQRNAEVGGKVGNAASEIKPEAVKTYEQFCIIIEQAVNLLSTEVLNQLFIEIDELRRKYAALQPKKTSKENSENSDEESEVIE